MKHFYACCALIGVLLVGSFYSASAQNTCGSPTVVTQASLPYTATTVTTCGTGNDYTSGNTPGCASTDIRSGEEIVYSITPTSNICIDIVITNPSTGGAGIIVTDSCPTQAGGECLDNDNSLSTSGDSLMNLPLRAGHPYYILLGRSTCFTFDILIRESSTLIADLGKTCCNPTPMALPFSQDNLTTGGFEDDYSASEICQSAGLGNNAADYDRVWSYVSAGNECMDIKIVRDSASTEDTRAGVWVTYETCPKDPSINCIGGADQDGQTYPDDTCLAAAATLTAAGTYYIIVATSGNPDSMIFDMDITLAAITSTGLDCSAPIVIGSLPYTVTGATTCCMADDYDENDTCQTSYMEGQDVIYTYTATGAETLGLDLTNTDGNADMGIAVLTDCPNAVGATCIASDGSTNGGTPLQAALPGAGTYYIVVGSDDDLECSRYDLFITSVNTDGDTCGNEIVIASLPYNVTNHTTCGKGNEFTSSMACTSSYMAGDDVIYSFTSGGNECLSVTVPNGSVSEGSDIGLFLLDGCPADGATSCLAEESELNSNGQNDGVSLQYTISAAGTYYIVVANRSTNPCMFFDLNVATSSPVSPGATCADPQVIGGLPYSVTNQTTFCSVIDYDNTDACADIHMDGEDFIYSYTPGSNQCIVATIDNTDSDAGLFILDGCPDAGATCLGAANGSTATVTANLTSGTTYYLVVARDTTGGEPLEVSYDLTITSPATGSAGYDCSTPQTIGSIPYTNTGLSTCCYGDDYDNTDACGSAFMNGDDYVFDYTPTAAGCIDVTVSNTGGNTVGVFIVDACPDAGGATCMGNASGTNPTASATLASGTTYYIVVSTNGTPQCTQFDISVSSSASGDGTNDFYGAATMIYGPTPTTITGLSLATATTDIPGDFAPPTFPCGVVLINRWYAFEATATTVDFVLYTTGVAMPTGIVFEHDGCCDNFVVRSNFDCPIGGPAVRNFTATGLTIGETYLVHIDGNTNSEFDLEVTNNIAGNPLPVELLTFTGTNKGSYNLLEWSTASELNTDYFIIERRTSDDEWASIGTVVAASRSTQVQEYSLRDNEPPVGMAYYRLKSVDQDGDVQESKIVALKNYPEGGQLVVEGIYPNPTTGLVHFDISSLAETADLHMELRDNSGRLIMQHQPTVVRGDNELLVDMSEVARGTYTCIIRTDTEIVDVTQIVRQ